MADSDCDSVSSTHSAVNWGIDSTATPQEDGFAARVAVAAPYPVKQDVEFDTRTMQRVRETVAAVD